MRKQIHPSDSIEQQSAETEVLKLLNKKLKINLVSEKITVNKTTFQLDGYSKNPPVLCEIYSRIGKLKPAQKNKINKDILKMLLIEKITKKKFRKIIAFANEEAAKSFLSGESWSSKLKDHFGIEIITVKISPALRKKLLGAQERQYR